MYKTILKTTLIILFILSFYGFLNPASPVKTKESNNSPIKVTNQEWVDSVYNSLTLEEKIGQLFMVSAYTGAEADNKTLIENLITEYHIGGIIFMKGEPTKQAAYSNHFQSMSKTPLLMSIDGEWGLAMRLDSTVSFPKQLTLGAIQNNRLIYEMGKEIGRQCNRIGLHINFAPSVDVNNNAKNPVINFRSFGEIKQNVAKKGEYYMAGMQDMNILTTAKHFPGHGDTDVDSHKDLPVIAHKKKRLDTLELYPFKYLVNKNITGVMVSHLYVPALDKTPNMAATLSPKIINGVLKKDMRFKGLVFTDALNMHGITKHYKPGEIEVKALLAGNDVLLFPVDVPIAVKYITEAIKNGELDIKIIEEKCKNIIAAKQWAGLDNYKDVKIKNLIEDLNTPYAQTLKKQLIREAITIVKDEQKILPFKRLDTCKIAYVSFCRHKNDTFYIAAKNYTEIAKFCFPPKPTENEISLILDTLKNYNTVILNIEGTTIYSSRKYGITPSIVNITKKIAEENNTIMVLHANPYALDFFTPILPKIPTIVVAYDFAAEYQFETPQVLFGAYDANGKLPISAGGFTAGTGLSYKSISRLKYTTPYEAGLEKDTLSYIDSLVQEAINEKAFPGCQVLVARKGKVVYQKSFGHFTYDQEHNVTNDDLYDLASITKSAATTVALMNLYEDSLFSINATLGDYLPEAKGTNKDTLVMKNILAHQAQLHSWIPFYQYMIKDYFNPKIKICNRKQTNTFPHKMANDCYLKHDYSFVDSSISSTQTDLYRTEVAENVFINPAYKDSIFNSIYCSELNEKKKVVYSDLGFYLFADIIDNLSGKTIDNYLYDNFYTTLGAHKLCYTPLNRFSKYQIAPTENDQIFRKQTLQGYVHDPGAAMLGGISGHAGLFSNTNDLAKLLQMLLNKGSYGGIRYLQEETINLFTSCQFCEQGNRKGLGFDKAWDDNSKLDPTCSCTSPLSYGHSGFTGTIFWVDPKHDIVYIFLSNRVHPDAENPKLGKMNIRPNIQKIIYDAIIVD